MSINIENKKVDELKDMCKKAGIKTTNLKLNEIKKILLSYIELGEEEFFKTKDGLMNKTINELKTIVKNNNIKNTAGKSKEEIVKIIVKFYKKTDSESKPPSPKAKAISPKAKAISPKAKAISPKAKAISPKAKKCKDDEVLNIKTNKCVKKTGKIGKEILKAKATSPKAPSPKATSPKAPSPKATSPKAISPKAKKCKDDEVLNEETNRCVKKSGKKGQEILKKKALLKTPSPKAKTPSPKAKTPSPKAPKAKKCKDDEVLNEETNRCVKKSGKKGQEILKKKADMLKASKAVSPKALSPKALSPKALSPKALSPKAISKASSRAVSPKALFKVSSPKALSKTLDDKKILNENTIKFMESKKEFKSLSNYWVKDIIINGITYPSGVHAFYGEILRNLSDLYTYKNKRKEKLLNYSKIFQEDTDPSEAYKKGNSFDFNDDEINELNSVEVQKQICMYKYENYKEVRDDLIKSDNKILINSLLRCSDEDIKNRYWEGKAIVKNGEIQILGENRLGELWMEIRDQMQGEQVFGGFDEQREEEYQVGDIVFVLYNELLGEIAQVIGFDNAGDVQLKLLNVGEEIFLNKNLIREINDQDVCRFCNKFLINHTDNDIIKCNEPMYDDNEIIQENTPFVEGEHIQENIDVDVDNIETILDELQEINKISVSDILKQNVQIKKSIIKCLGLGLQ